VREPAEEAHLRRRAKLSVDDDRVRLDARRFEPRQKLAPGRVVAHRETSEARAPSDARFIAQLVAPPGTVSVRSWRRIITGASRDTRLISHDTNWSATASPTTTTRRPANARTSAESLWLKALSR
jgi:hypothetical protein